MHHYYIVHKPYGMLSQFTGGAEGLRMLGGLDYPFPEGTNAVGRLDYHSEGLLILTTNPKVTKLLFEGPQKHKRSYLVQVYKAVLPETLQHLRDGISIRIAGGEYYTTAPCEIVVAKKPEGLPAGVHELRGDIPHSWLLITLTEGKYRQVRKMLYAAGHRCMRLIRLSIEDLALGTLQAGEVLEVPEQAFFSRLHIDI